MRFFVGEVFAPTTTFDLLRTDRKEVRNEGANASTAARQKRRNLYFSYTSVNSHVFFMTFANREPQ